MGDTNSMEHRNIIFSLLNCRSKASLKVCLLRYMDWFSKDLYIDPLQILSWIGKPTHVSSSPQDSEKFLKVENKGGGICWVH